MEQGLLGWGFLSTKHIIGLAVMATLAATFFLLMHFFVNKRGEKATKWALRGIIIFMIVLEVAKFVLIFQEIGSIYPGNFPLALCSMPLYLFPIVAFGKGKFAQLVKPVAFTIGLLAGAVTIIYPSNVLYLDQSACWADNGFYNFAFISFLYHTSMIVFAVYMLVSKTYKMKGIDALIAFAGLFLLALVAIFFNWAIGGEADYFLLGKGYGSPLQFIIEKANHFVYILAMMGLGIIAVFLLYSYHIIRDSIRYSRSKKEFYHKDNKNNF